MEKGKAELGEARRHQVGRVDGLAGGVHATRERVVADRVPIVNVT